MNFIDRALAKINEMSADDFLQSMHKYIVNQ